MTPVLLVHGGAGRVPEDGGVEAREGVEAAASLAWHLLEEARHVLVVGEGAEQVAGAHGLPRCRPGELVTPARRAAWERGRADRGRGTVGAVARDRAGRLAAATSTGGMAGKRAGRVGDSPLIGCGTYADARGAASATGDGEAIIRVVLAARAVDACAPGTDPAAVSAAALARMRSLTGGTGGLLLLEAGGRAGAAHTTPFMAVARRGGGT